MQCTCAILWSVASPAVQYFSTLSHKRHGFRKKKVVHKMCVSMLSSASAWNIFILRRTEWDMIKIVCWYSCNYLSFLSDLNETWNFWAVFRKINQISNFMKTRPEVAELFDADGWIDMKLIVSFRNFASAPKNDILLKICQRLRSSSSKCSKFPGYLDI
jgi:hypothetical protein